MNEKTINKLIEVSVSLKRKDIPILPPPDEWGQAFQKVTNYIKEEEPMKLFFYQECAYCGNRMPVFANFIKEVDNQFEIDVYEDTQICQLCKKNTKQNIVVTPAA